MPHFQIKPKRQPKFIRTCQECGHEQEARDPRSYPTGNDSWIDLKCHKCRGTECFDFGSWRETNPYWIKKDLEAFLNWESEDEKKRE